jgi:hypothetical protein
MRRELTVIPGDITSQSHIVAFIRSLISRELSDPARVEADAQRAAKLAEEARQKAIDDLASRQAAEKAAVEGAKPGADANEQVAADLDAKHAVETDALARQHALDDLARKQAEENKALAAKQADERAALTAAPRGIDFDGSDGGPLPRDPRRPDPRDPRRPDPRDPQFMRPSAQ